MSLVFIFFAAVLVWLSFKSFQGGLAYLRYFRSDLDREPTAFTPFATVVAPCRGLDAGLEENLKAVILQEYPNFEVIFVVDDADDPAVQIVKPMLSDRIRLIVAPQADASSQKVENLRTAVANADRRSEVFIFVDSDVRTSPDWLKNLVSRLEDPNVGAATGYRWFISDRRSFASELRSVWNASIASALGPKPTSNFCWGGSMAIRRDVFDRLNIAERWKGTLSDDFTVTRAMKMSGMPIVFVPGALTASIGSCSFAEMLEFTTRQMKITRVYARHLWISSLIGSALFVSVMVASLLVLVFSVDLYLQIAAGATLFLVSFFSIAKAKLRLDAVRIVLHEYKTALKRQRISQYTLWLLTPALFLYNSLAALASSRIVWRGTVYELKSPSETVIIRD